MKDLFRYGFILSLICMLATGLLSGAHSLTKSKITSQAQGAEEASIREVMPESWRFEPVESGNEIIYYRTYSRDGEFMGVAFKTSAKGYSGVIDTMVGMTKDGTIRAIKILQQNETPGLGNRITEPLFTNRFSQKDISQLNGVEAITGATISSKAVIDSVYKKAQEIKRLIPRPSNEGTGANIKKEGRGEK